MRRQKLFAVLATSALLMSSLAFFMPEQASAAPFTEYTVIPSRVEVSITDVNFLIKADAVSGATEDAVTVQFANGFTVDGTPANITVSTTDIALWDAECTNAWPGIGTATGVSGNTITFPSTDLSVSSTYCFIITAGVDNPGSAGQYRVTTRTVAGAANVDRGSISLPIVDDDEVVITASVNPYVTCDVTTTDGADNAVDLQDLVYGSVTSSSTLPTADNIQISGATNAAEGMEWKYRSDAANNGLYSATATDLLDGPNAELTINATTSTCAAGTPCYGIYYNGTTAATTGAFTADADFTGGTVTTDAGPMTTSVYGEPLGNTGGTTATGITADFNVNATAAQDTVIASDYTDTLIFTCKADI